MVPPRIAARQPPPDTTARRLYPVVVGPPGLCSSAVVGASAAVSQWKTGGMAFVDVGPMRMYYDRRGPREAETLVLLHGGGGDATDTVGGWAGLADRFAEHFDVVLPDHRGHGRTANPDGWMSFTQMGDDLNALLEHLDAGPVHLAGISDGGVMVLDQALRRPETVRTGVIIGANYCVDERTLGAAEGIDPDSIERDHPDVAAAFAARHDGGSTRASGRT